MYTFESPYVTGPDEPITMVVSLELKPGTEKRAEEHISLVISKNRLEEGCLESSFLRVQGKSSHYVWLNDGKNQSALRWHIEQPYTQAIFAMFELILFYPMLAVFHYGKFVEEIPPNGE